MRRELRSIIMGIMIGIIRCQAKYISSDQEDSTKSPRKMTNMIIYITCTVILVTCLVAILFCLLNDRAARTSISIENNQPTDDVFSRIKHSYSSINEQTYDLKKYVDLMKLSRKIKLKDDTQKMTIP